MNEYKGEFHWKAYIFSEYSNLKHKLGDIISDIKITFKVRQNFFQMHQRVNFLVFILHMETNFVLLSNYTF